MSAENQTLPDLCFCFQGMVIPDYMRGSLERYVHKHVAVGSFLQAVIKNGLKEAVACADDENLHAIPAYVNFFYNWAPSACWGSPEAYERWTSKNDH